VKGAVKARGSGSKQGIVGGREIAGLQNTVSNLQLTL
jgi:hypothetical protein